MSNAAVIALLAVGCTGDDKPGRDSAGDDHSTSPIDDSTATVDDSTATVDDSTATGDDSTSPVDDSATEVVLVPIYDNVEAFQNFTSHEIYSAEAVLSEDGSSVDGEVNYYQTINGHVVCDEQIAFTGTPYSGACINCDYDFMYSVEGEVTDHGGDDDCRLHTGQVYISDGFFINPVLAFDAEREIYDDYTWYTYRDVVLAGIGVDYTFYGGEGVLPGPYFYSLVYEGDYRSFGSADFADNVLTWAWDKTSNYGMYSYYGFCRTKQWSYATELYGGTAVFGSVDCNGSQKDAWAVQADAGQEVFVTVDVPTGDGDYFDPTLVVTDEAGCGVLWTNNNAACSFCRSCLENCPSGHFTAEEGGNYLIWIRSSGGYCSLGTDVDYKLMVEFQ